jgi:hypothetical protein
VSFLAPFLISNKPSAGSAFTMLKMFGLEHEVEKPIGGQAITLSKVLTLCHELHIAFHHFPIWLEEVPGQVRFTSCLSFFLSYDKSIRSQENTYHVVMAEKMRRVLQRIAPRPATCVTFKVDPDCESFCKENDIALPELPSRDLIYIHAACAQIAHMSGFAEQIEQIKRMQQLWHIDGSTGDLVTSLLNAHAITVGA